MGPVCCHQQMDTATYKAQVEKVRRAMAKFTGHPDAEKDPFTSDLAREGERLLPTSVWPHSGPLIS